MRSDLCGGHGTKRVLGKIATNNRGGVVDMEDLRRRWNAGEDIVEICVAHDVTIPLLYRIVRKFGKDFDQRSFSGGDGTTRRMDNIPEKELIDLIKVRTAAIRRTWTPEVERSRRTRHSIFLEN